MAEVSLSQTSPFQWTIEGFSALLSRRSVTYCYSGTFTANGFTWKLRLEPNASGEDGEKAVSLHLLLVDDSSSTGSVVKAIYRLFVYDRSFGRDVRKECEDYFHSASCDGLCCKVPLKKIKDPKSGLIVNDCCVFGAEVQEAFACTLERKDVTKCWSLNKEIAPVVVYTWVIDDFLNIDSFTDSGKFHAGGYTWHMAVFSNRDFPEGEQHKDYLGILLSLDNSAALPSNTSFYVKLTISVLNRIDGKRKMITAGTGFSSECTEWVWPMFLAWKDVEDRSKGFVRNGLCVIEASVTVLGSVTVF